MSADDRSNAKTLPFAWDSAGHEPDLTDLLSDPVVHLIMGRDRLDRADVEAAIARGRQALRRRLCGEGLYCAA